MPLRSILLSFTAALGLSLAFIACGGDDDNKNSTSPSASTSASASSGASSSVTAKPNSSGSPRRTSTPKPTATGEDTTPTPEDTTAVDDTTPEIDECGLVSLDDVKAAVPSDTFTSKGELAGDTCHFGGDNGFVVEVLTYDLSAYGEGNEKEFFETFASLFDDEILDSPGDEAYFDETLGLSILKSPYELDITVEDADGVQDHDAAFALAEPALSNMP